MTAFDFVENKVCNHMIVWPHLFFNVVFKISMKRIDKTEFSGSSVIPEIMNIGFEVSSKVEWRWHNKLDHEHMPDLSGGVKTL